MQKQDDTDVKASVQQAEADLLRLDRTPMLFINGEKVEGVVPIETIYKMIDRALIAAGQTPPPPPPPAEHYAASTLLRNQRVDSCYASHFSGACGQAWELAERCG